MAENRGQAGGCLYTSSLTQTIASLSVMFKRKRQRKYTVDRLIRSLALTRRIELAFVFWDWLAVRPATRTRGLLRIEV
jgi:hypothetical protein